MSRIAALLMAAGAQLREMETQSGARVFTEVKVELDRYDFADLLTDSTRAPTARVCLLRAKPVSRSDAGLDQDVSVAIVVVAGRSGRANPDLSSADLAALGLLDQCALSLMAEPYVGLGKLQAAELGDAMVVMSEQSNKHGIAIALMEVKWRLLDVFIARPAIQRALETGREAFNPTSLTINGGAAQPRSTDAEPEPAP
jgi:hypothetical protein